MILALRDIDERRNAEWEAIPQTDKDAAWEAIPASVRADLVLGGAAVIGRNDREGLSAPYGDEAAKN